MTTGLKPSRAMVPAPVSSVLQQTITQKVAKHKRGSRTLPEYLDASQVAALLQAAPDALARFLLLVMWRAGLRVSEAIALEVADFQLDGDRPTLRVRRGKGNKPRLVPVHPELAAALRTRQAYGGAKGRLFEVSRATAWRWVQRAMAKAQDSGTIPQGKHVGNHTFRHSAARHWLVNGIPINVVQRWLGHARLQTTLIYLEILPDPLGNMERVP